MIKLDAMPNSGQFLAIWVYLGLPWAETMRWEHNTLMRYNTDSDSFHTVDINDYNDLDVTFYTVE